MTRTPVQEAPTVHADDAVASALRVLLDSGLPAVPVVAADGHTAGVFGEREFLRALFPGYVAELGYAGFVSSGLDEAIKKRAACAREPVSDHMNTEHVAVDEGFSDVTLAETFLHHRVLVVPVERQGRPIGVVTRSAFFHRLAEGFLDRS